MKMLVIFFHPNVLNKLWEQWYNIKQFLPGSSDHLFFPLQSSSVQSAPAVGKFTVIAKQGQEVGC